MVVEWGEEEGLLLEKTRWSNERWKKGHILEKDGKKILWDWEHKMRTHCKGRRLDLTVEDERKKEKN